jgi:hypothetical protein
VIILTALTPAEAVAVPNHVVHDEVRHGEDVEQHLWAALRHVPQELAPRLFEAMVSQPRLKRMGAALSHIIFPLDIAGKSSMSTGFSDEILHLQWIFHCHV